MITYGGVDGTSTEDETYAKTYYNSFINRLGRNELVRFVAPWYLRGPYLSGMDTGVRARACRDHVRDMYKSGRARAIFLGGHSRGGAAVIEAAMLLAQENIPVECLILFDAVDRSSEVGGAIWNTPISGNVKRVIHAQRDIWQTHSRLSFGNCGFTYGAGTDYRHQKFFATHSGIGGVPWPKATIPLTNTPTPTGCIWEPGEVNWTRVTPMADAGGSHLVWGWAQNHINTAYQQCVERLANEGPTADEPDYRIPSQTDAPHVGGPKWGRGGHVGGAGGVGGNPRIHVVVQGDWLSKIAIKYYGDAMKYKVIHQANLKVIGPNPDVIKPGQRLVIP
jgi:hypothetical protein